VAVVDKYLFIEKGVAWWDHIAIPTRHADHLTLVVLDKVMQLSQFLQCGHQELQVEELALEGANFGVVSDLHVPDGPEHAIRVQVEGLVLV